MCVCVCMFSWWCSPERIIVSCLVSWWEVRRTASRFWRRKYSARLMGSLESTVDGPRNRSRMTTRIDWSDDGWIIQIKIYKYCIPRERVAMRGWLIKSACGRWVARNKLIELFELSKENKIVDILRKEINYFGLNKCQTKVKVCTCESYYSKNTYHFVYIHSFIHCTLAMCSLVMASKFTHSDLCPHIYRSAVLAYKIVP